MARNRLLPQLPPPPRDPRCTGRTTAIALDLISRALKDQGKVCYATDHHEPGTHLSASNLAARVNELVAQMGLDHIAVTKVLTGGQYHGYVRVSSNIWEE